MLGTLLGSEDDECIRLNGVCFYGFGVTGFKVFGLFTNASRPVAIEACQNYILLVPFTFLTGVEAFLSLYSMKNRGSHVTALRLVIFVLS